MSGCAPSEYIVFEVVKDIVPTVLPWYLRRLVCVER